MTKMISPTFILNRVRALTALSIFQSHYVFTRDNNHHFHDEKLSKISYWKTRYKNKGTGNKNFDWFLDPQEIIEPLLNNVSQIQANTGMPLQYLDVGCGLSDLSIHLFTQSREPVSITLVDFVSEALQFQSRRMLECQHNRQCSPESTQHLVCADVVHLPFRDASFNVVIDKGTMDALLKNKLHGRSKSKLMMSEVARLLAPGGRYLQISDEDPDSRILLLETFSAHLNSNFVSDKDEHIYSHVRPDESIAQKRQLQKSHELSPWKFETIISNNPSEYFLYWTERLGV